MAADNGDDLVLFQDGKLFIRCRVARDRNLIDARGTAIRSPGLSLLLLPAALLVRRAR